MAKTFTKDIGLLNYRRKLTEAQVRDIRSSDKTQAELANLYGISQGLVSMIKNRTRYTWVK